MKHFAFLFIAITTLLSPALLYASDTWNSLVPETETSEDPFKQLTKTQLNDLGYYVGLKQDIERITETASTEVLAKRTKELKSLHHELSALGINIEHLLSMREKVKQTREKHATTPNKTVTNQSISIKGYVLPIEKQATLNTRFFLVKESPFISVSHNHQAPDPNQVIYIEYPQGKAIDYTSSITVSGSLKHKESNYEVALPDNHKVDINSVYGLKAEVITQ